MRVHARRELPDAVFFYSRFHSIVEISFRVYLVFSWMCMQRFAESPLSFPRCGTSSEGDLRFARTRSTRVKGSIAVRRKYEYETRRQVSFFLLLSWLFNQSREMVEFRIDNGWDNYEEKRKELLIVNDGKQTCF